MLKRAEDAIMEDVEMKATTKEAYLAGAGGTGISGNAGDRISEEEEVEEAKNEMTESRKKSIIMQRF